PTTAPLPEGLREERVALRLAGTSLAELVRLLHGLGSADPPIEIARLELRKRADDPRHFDATIEAARIVPAGAPRYPPRRRASWPGPSSSPSSSVSRSPPTTWYAGCCLASPSRRGTT